MAYDFWAILCQCRWSRAILIGCQGLNLDFLSLNGHNWIWNVFVCGGVVDFDGV